MDLKQLKYFVTIAEEKSISKAAKKLYMTQPPLSAQMKNLEEELNTKLFERGNKEIELTKEGSILYTKAKSILQMADTTLDEIASSKDNNKKTIRIGIVSSTIDYFVNDILVNFEKQNNDYRYELTEANTYELLEKMKNGIIECAVIRTPFNDKNYNSITLKQEKLYAISTNIYNNIDIKELSKHEIIVYRRWKDIIEEEMQKHDLKLKIKCLNDDARTTISLVKNGFGIGIIPESAVKFLPSDINALEIKNLVIESDIIFIYNKEQTSQTKTLIKFIKM